MPTPLVSRAISGLSGKKAGNPTMSSAPRTAPVIDARPPTTAMATTLSESMTRKRSGSKETRSPPNRPPARPARKPLIPKAVSLVRVGERPKAAAACSLSRTASIVRPMPLRRMRAMTTTARTSVPRQR